MGYICLQSTIISVQSNRKSNCHHINRNILGDKMKIKPTKNILQTWIETYVPEKDLFFLTKEDLITRIDSSGVLIVPSEEFFNNSTYMQINYVNSCEYCNE